MEISKLNKVLALLLLASTFTYVLATEISTSRNVNISDDKTGHAKRQIVESPLEVIETGLQATSMGVSLIWWPVGDWLDDHTILLNVLQNNDEASANFLQRVVLFDTEKRESTTLIADGRSICWNEFLKVINIAPNIYKRGVGTQLYRMNKQRQLEILDRPEQIRERKCYRNQDYPGDKADTMLRLEIDGYIDLEMKVNAGNVGNIDRAIWHKPGRAPVELTIPASQIDSGKALYLPYLGKYLLRSTDSRVESGTNRALSGANWKFAYELAPYSLLGTDGKVEQISYPYVLAEFGIKQFSEFLPVKDGIVIRTDSDLFLMKGEALFRIWTGRSSALWGKTEWPKGLAVSPDGCKIAFTHYADIARDSKKPVSIINICSLI